MTIKILKGSRNHKSLIVTSNENSITHLIKTLATRQEKVDLIAERNPLHYMFGEYLRVRKYNESYEDFINRNYIGRIK
jgi:hypothetical protein